MKQLVLSLCDYSHVWGSQYESQYQVVYWDIQSNPLHDVRLMKFLGGKRIRGIICQPPCTHFASSGAWKWAEKGTPALLEGLSIVDACLRMVTAYQPDWWVLENPVGRLRDYLGPYRMTFNPCDYAGYADNPNQEAYTKRTLLWGNFNTKLIPNPVPVINSLYIRDLPPGKERHNIRSRTPQGFARAFYQANP